eukprot:GHVN01060047.1.p1 GENE.GHVN01060047.1~~GHVN01060047.1.p1  ORF type:complete len:636 (+),score=84.92 GHVN01060047.1:2-1909(+)
MAEAVARLREKHFGGLAPSKDLGSVVFIQGLPVTTNVAKLQMFVGEKLLNGATDGLELLLDDQAQKTNGAAFVDVGGEKQALALEMRLDGLRIDREHRLRCSLLSRFHFDGDKVSWVALEDNHRLRVESVGTPKTERTCESSFFVQKKDRIFVVGKSKGAFLTELSISRDGILTCGWSPKGTYFWVCLKAGLILFDGDTLEEYSAAFEEGVNRAVFSPDERHVATYSSDRTVLLWRCCAYELQLVKRFRGEGLLSAPALRWSWAGREFSLLVDGELRIYELVPVDGYSAVLSHAKKIFGSKNVVACEWAPARNELLYCVSGEKNAPFRAVLGTKEGPLKTRSLFGDVSARVYWSSKHALSVLEQSGKKKTRVELFCVLEKNIPVETLDIAGTVSLVRVCEDMLVLCGKDEVGEYFKLFAIKESGEMRLECVKELRRNGVKTIEWTFDGAFLLVYSLDSESRVDILDRNGSAVGGFSGGGISGIGWDAYGEHILTHSNVAMSGAQQTDYSLYDCTGKRISRAVVDGIMDAGWRPIDTESLFAATKALEGKMDEYRKEFIEEDKKHGDNGDEDIGRWEAWKERRRVRRQNMEERLRQCSEEDACEAPDDGVWVEREEAVSETVMEEEDFERLRKEQQ